MNVISSWHLVNTCIASTLQGICLALLAGHFFLCSEARAERFPLSPIRLNGESEVVVVAEIVELRVQTERSHIEPGIGNYDWAIDVTLKIDELEKGRPDPGATIVARCFRFKCRGTVKATLCPSGNHPIPDVGTRVRAHLYRRNGLWRVVYPNGLAPVVDDTQLSDAAVIRRLHGWFTFLLPLELWIVIGFVGAVIVHFARAMRRAEKSTPPARKLRTTFEIPGACLHFVGLCLVCGGGFQFLTEWLVFLAALRTCVRGCRDYAREKGRSDWFSLVGIAGIVGVIALAVLPDRRESLT